MAKDTKRPGRGSDQFPLRLPDGMRERIKRHAENNGRSMNAEVVNLIEYGLWEADMSRMQSGMEPLRKVTDGDWEIIRHAREVAARQKAAPSAHSDSDGIPFFDEGPEPDREEPESRIFLAESKIDEREFVRVLAEENRKAFATAMQRLGVKLAPLEDDDNSKGKS